MGLARGDSWWGVSKRSWSDNVGLAQSDSWLSVPKRSWGVLDW